MNLVVIIFRCVRDRVPCSRSRHRPNCGAEKDAILPDRRRGPHGHPQGNISVKTTGKVRPSKHCQVSGLGCYINKTLIVLHTHTLSCLANSTAAAVFCLDWWLLLPFYLGEYFRWNCERGELKHFVLCLPNEVGSQWIRKLHVVNS